MKEFSLSQQCALVALDGLSSIHNSMAKRAALRSIAAAQVLESILSDDTGMDASLFEKRLLEELVKIKEQNKRQAKQLEKEITLQLKEDGVLEEVADILGCDMYYYTADVSIKAYRSDRETVTSIIEGLRAEILEEGEITLECACLLWCFREARCIQELFSKEEQMLVKDRMVRLSGENELYRILWQTEFRNGLESFSIGFLQSKSKAFENPYLEGMNAAFPFLERRQAIFIDFVIFGTTVAGRRAAVESFLSERGHYVEEIKNGTETLLRIDNICYRVFPKTVTMKVPIQGVLLLPVSIYW